MDRTYLFLIDYEKNNMTYSHEWCKHGIKKEVEPIKEISLTNFSWFINSLKVDNVVNIEDTDNMPQKAIVEQKYLLKLNVKSMLAVPIEGEENIQGFIGLQSIDDYKKWSQDEINLTNILSTLIASALIKMKSEIIIENMAYYDHLTQLPNRFLFINSLKQSIEQAKRNENFISVIFIDLDDFKSVNDSMGHSGGDLLLKQFSHSIKNRLRKIDVISRFGGDEFAILLNNIQDPKDIENIIKDLMYTFLDPFNIFNQEVFITGSIGITIYPIDGEDANTLIKNADAAMYKAKAKGKNQYFMCTANIKSELQRNIILSNDLYRVLERDELKLYYQPQIDLSKGLISGIEAILYWKHPEFGMISPETFIPLVGKSNLNNAIGQWVLTQACKQCKKWQDMGMDDLTISINIFTNQFINPNLAHQIEKTLESTGLKAKYLELEIKESLAINKSYSSLDILTKLKNIGVLIVLDDFGIDNSSLTHLKVLPIDKIKINMQFIEEIEKSEKDRAIIMILIDLAKSLNLNVLAEGVQNKSQEEFLINNSCDLAQGFYFYEPLLASNIDEIFKSQRCS